MPIVGKASRRESLLNGGQVHRVYLKELGDIGTLPLGLAVMVLTTKTRRQMPGVARALLERNRQEVANPVESRAIIDMVSTIVVYQFIKLSRREVDEMLGIRLEETRVYQEAREDEARSLILRQLPRLIGEISDEMKSRVEGLSLEGLGCLSEELLDFGSIADLETWLDNNA
jgi:predicted transposase YdaD